MIKFAVFITLVSATCVLSAPNPLRSLPALQHEHLQDEFGQYALRYVTAEGTMVVEKGKLVANTDGTGHVMIMEGEVTFVADNGKTYVTKYTAGLDGVKVEGDHLPVAPTDIPPQSSVTPSVSTVAISEETTTSAAVVPEAPAVPSANV